MCGGGGVHKASRSRGVRFIPNTHTPPTWDTFISRRNTFDRNSTVEYWDICTAVWVVKKGEFCNCSFGSFRIESSQNF